MEFLPNQVPTARRLCELLQEQQEPFVLEVYLLEQGCSKKIHSPHISRDVWFSFVLKNRDGFPKCLNLMKSVLTKIPFVKNSKKQNHGRKACYAGRFSDFVYDTDMGTETQVAELRQSSSAISSGDGNFSSFCNFGETKVEELARFSSTSCPSVFDSCSEGNMDELLPPQYKPLSTTDSLGSVKVYTMKDKVSGDRRLHSNSKQFSPVSVLEIPFDEASPGHNQLVSFPRGENPTNSNFNLLGEFTKDAVMSTSICELLVYSLREEQELNGFCSSSQTLMRPKKLLQQRRQLPLDCVKEEVQRTESKGTRWQAFGSSENRNTERFIFELIFSLEKQGGSATNITQMLSYDLWEAKEEWDQFQPQKTQIGNEVAAALFEEIRNEMVVDMLESFVLRG